VGATDVPELDGAVPEPYIVAKLGFSVNEQKTRTASASATSSPVWNETRHFEIGDYERETFEIGLWAKGNDKDRIGKAEVPVSDFKPGKAIQKVIKLEPGCAKITRPSNLTIKVTVRWENKGVVAGPIAAKKPASGSGSGSQSDSSSNPAPKPAVVVTRDVDLEADEGGSCGFSWGNYGSNYASNFSNYSASKIGTGYQLSDADSGEEEKHHHPPVPSEPAKPKKKKKKVKGKPKLSGTVISAKGLIRSDSDGTDSYVVVTEAGKKVKEPPKSTLVHDTEDPRYDFQFDLGEVTAGGAVEFTVFQSHKILGDAPIGYAKVNFDAIEPNSADQVNVVLEKPAKFKKIGKVADFPSYGTLQVVYNYTGEE
jgi:Ca2+-dependent lipid-binding protein